AGSGLRLHGRHRAGPRWGCGDARHPRPVAAGEPGGARHRGGRRVAARGAAGGRAVSREAGGGRRAECADGAAAGGRRAADLPAALAFRAARQLGAAVHPGGDGDRAGGAGHADPRRPLARGAGGAVGGICRGAALLRRRALAGGADAALGWALRPADRAARRLRPGQCRGGRGDPGRRQYRGLHPDDDDGHRARDQQGRPAAGPCLGAGADGHRARGECAGAGAARCRAAPGRL
ncbi:MAG: Tungstate ABC transporter, permease protein, partial [uncultured Craurococcus sp.]